jgi:hypothetical protein
LGTFYVDGAKLSIKGQGKAFTIDLATTLGVDKDVDWTKLKAIKFGDKPVRIEKKANGLDLILNGKGAENDSNRTFKVRWDIKERK